MTATATRIEYGAKVVQTGTIYMHDFDTQTVQKFITEFSTASPLTLVTRTWDGETHTAWQLAK